MYYKDLTPYEYGYTAYKDALNVGWLEGDKEYMTGDFPEKEQVLTKLKSMKRKNLYRGWHSCDGCDPYRKVKESDGWHTYLVEDRNGNGEYIVHYKGKTYAAPTLIIHYIEAHNYLPPKEFINAVINTELC